ncbi:MAG: FMN-binding protein [Planctomycetota bacterium]|jgi:uncharacterized protein with FMN-binding domain
MVLSQDSTCPISAGLLATCLTLAIATLPGCGGSSAPENAATDAQPQSPTDLEETRPNGTAEVSDSEPEPASTSDLEDAATASPASTVRAEPTAEPATEPVEPSTTTETAGVQASPADSSSAEAAAAAQLEKELGKLMIPPAWLTDVTSQWDMNKPWKEGRQEIRRLLGKGDDASRREGVKLMWDYKTKDDMGDGHEYGMYLFLGNQPLWAVAAFRERLAGSEHEYPPYFDLKALASLYTERGMFSEAEKLLRNGLDWAPPKAEWLEMRQAEMHDSLGDLYAAWGRLDDARTHYQASVRLYPLGKPPYGRHLLPRRAKKVQNKLDLLSMRSLKGATLEDGMWKHTALGYSGDVHINVRISGGRIDAINIQHEEKIDQGATTTIPQRIIDSQSLAVDGVSGATVTKDAIVTGTLEALRKAGLK